MVLEFTAYFGNQGIDLEAQFKGGPKEACVLFILALVGDILRRNGRVRDISRDYDDNVQASIALPEKHVRLIRDELAGEIEWLPNIKPLEWTWVGSAVLQGTVDFGLTDEEVLDNMRSMHIL